MSKVEGEMGFGESKKEEIIDKEETMFKVDEKGMAIPERYPIYIYDRTIDEELRDEAFRLMDVIKKQKAINKSIEEAKRLQNEEIIKSKAKAEAEKDEKVKKGLLREIELKQRALDMEAIKTKMNFYIIEDNIKESREIIKDLKQEKEKQKIKKFVEIMPCNTSESYLAFEKGKTIKGKETTDWVADLISKKVINPQYSLEEAKRLKPDFKIALKEAIMEASNYKTINYRDIIIQKRLEDEKPLTLKKD